MVLGRSLTVGLLVLHAATNDTIRAVRVNQNSNDAKDQKLFLDKKSTFIIKKLLSESTMCYFYYQTTG